MSSDKIRIDTDKLEDISQQLSRLSSSLASIDIDLSGISVTALLVVSEEPDIIRNINSLKNRVSASRRYAYKLSGAVQNASARWAKVETELASQALGTGDESASDSAADGAEAISNAIFNLLQKILGNVGAYGKVVSAIWSGLEKGTAKDWAKALVDIGAAGINLIKEGLKGTSADWAKAIFGLGEYGKTVGETFVSGIGNPVSWITNGIKSLIDNWDLAKDDPLRFATETFVETVTKSVVDATGKSLVVAIVGSSASALVVTIGGAVLVWGANTYIKSVTGKEIAEIVADSITSGNLIKDISTGFKKMGETAVQLASDIVDNAAAGFETMLDTGAQIVSDFVNTTAGWLNSIFA